MASPVNYYSPGQSLSDRIAATVASFFYVGALNTGEDVFAQGKRTPACFIRLAAMTPADRERVDGQHWNQDWDIVIVTDNPADGQGGWRGITEAGLLVKAIREDALDDYRPPDDNDAFSRFELINSPFETIVEPGGYLATFLRVRTKFVV